MNTYEVWIDLLNGQTVYDTYRGTDRSDIAQGIFNDNYDAWQVTLRDCNGHDRVFECLQGSAVETVA